MTSSSFMPLWTPLSHLYWRCGSLLPNQKQNGFPFGRVSIKEAKSLNLGPAGLRLRPLAASLPGPQPFLVKPTW